LSADVTVFVDYFSDEIYGRWCLIKYCKLSFSVDENRQVLKQVKANAIQFIIPDGTKYFQ